MPQGMKIDDPAQWVREGDANRRQILPQRRHVRDASREDAAAGVLLLAKQLDAATKRGENLGLTDDEVAFYDALAANESAVKAMGDDKLKVIAAELITQVRKSVTIDWTLRESARAKIKVMV